MTLRRYAPDLRNSIPADVILISGNRDPLPNREAINGLIEVPGAHACHFSYPEETAEAVTP